MSYFKQVKKAIKDYEHYAKRKPSNIKLSRDVYNALKKEIEDMYPMVKTDSEEQETIFGIPIEVVDEFPT